MASVLASLESALDGWAVLWSPSSQVPMSMQPWVLTSPLVSTAVATWETAQSDDESLSV